NPMTCAEMHSCRPAAGTTIEGALCAGTQSALRFAFAVVVPAAGRHHNQTDHGRGAHKRR
ncbi:hypothetical protein, partial [Stenotrophomonas maltophilia]|uniref:hypothetical protein n=1 Tax=Stenotrophomonas maltophilia TaxID=40324 RepID=UPI0039C224B5